MVEILELRHSIAKRLRPSIQSGYLRQTSVNVWSRMRMPHAALIDIDVTPKALECKGTSAGCAPTTTTMITEHLTILLTRTKQHLNSRLATFSYL